MWIELADSLPNNYALPNLHICSVLEAAAFSSFNGKHVLYGSRKTLQWVLKQEISAPAKAAVSRALTTIAERGAFRENISSRLTIETGTGAIKRGEGENWIAPIESLFGVTLQSVEVLAENLRDASALKYAAIHFKKIKKFYGFEISLIPSNGGGAEILPSFLSSIASRAKFTLAVTDSDIDHPGGTACHISRQCILASKSADWICRHIELPCREIENLLPFNIVDDTIRASPKHAEIIEALNKVSEICAIRSDALKYADLKSGTLTINGVQLDNNHARRNYWSSIIKDCKIECRSCSATCDQGNCKCNIIPGLGSKILQHFLDYCSETTIQKQVERLNTSPHREDWLRIGKAVFDWALADPPVRS